MNLTSDERRARADTRARIRHFCDLSKDYSLALMLAGFLEPILAARGTLTIQNFGYLLAGLILLIMGWVLAPQGEPR